MPRTPITSLALVLLLIAGACSNNASDSVSAGGSGDATQDNSQDSGKDKDNPVNPDDPFGTTEWVLVQASVDGVDLELLDQYPVTLQRNGDDVDGSAACNSYFGTIVNGEFLFEGFGATEMACDPSPMSLEFSFLEALGRVTTAQGGPELILSGDEVELRFAQVAVTPDASIEGTAWMLDTLIEGEAASSTISGSTATLNFDSGTVSGSDGCNTFRGDYELNGDTLKVGLLSLTARGCEDGIMSQAQRVGEVLGATPTISVDGDRLSLSTAGGLELVYRAS